MRIFIFLSIFLTTFFGESFITEKEYGEMLYKNPRGIGCNKCHGTKGEGSLIAKYKDKNATDYYEVKIIAPPLNTLSLQEFIKGVTKQYTKQELKNRKNIGFMPEYFLTQDEIIILYKFIKDLNKEKKK